MTPDEKEKLLGEYQWTFTKIRMIVHPYYDPDLPHLDAIVQAILTLAERRDRELVKLREQKSCVEETLAHVRLRYHRERRRTRKLRVLLGEAFNHLQCVFMKKDE